LKKAVKEKELQQHNIMGWAPLEPPLAIRVIIPGTDSANCLTIRGTRCRRSKNWRRRRATGLLGDFDFDKALVKFANERENFLDDLGFSAGAPIQKREPMTNPRADRIRIEEGDILGSTARRSPLRSVGGSIRRKISFRDMNSMKRQPSVQRTSEWSFLG
jgi:hypothetical protein